MIFLIKGKIMSKWIRNIEGSVNRMWDEISALGAQYRNQVLVPFCRRNNLVFISGMGAYAFFRGEQEIAYRLAPPDEIPKYMQQVLKVLDTEIVVNSTFGEHIDDIREEDL